MAKDRPNKKFLPYGRQQITQEDIDAVVDVLRSDWLTQGPNIEKFEAALADAVGARHAIACSNGTAALHLAILALDLGPGDVVAVSPITFVADANCARFVGADVRFVDVDPATACMDPDELAKVFRADTEHKIKAVIPVHFAGQPARLPEIYDLAKAHGAAVIDDACHAIGATYEHDGKTHRIGDGAHSDMTVFSFHPVKHVAMGEGGAVTTNRDDLAERLSMLRTHGIVRESFQNDEMAYGPDGSPNAWYHEMQALGYNYRLTDIQAALGLSQLSRLDGSVRQRNEIAGRYDNLLREAFPDGEVRPLGRYAGTRHAFHLFVALFDFDKLGLSRHELMLRLRDEAIGTQVHYIPVHLQPYYRKLYGHGPGDFPEADRYYDEALSLPMYPGLTDDDVVRVVDTLKKVTKRTRVPTD